MPEKTKPTRAVAAVPIEEFAATTNWMIYGVTGVGKTTLAATLPGTTFISPEPGIIAAAREAKARGTAAKVWPQSKTWEGCEAALIEAERGNFDTPWVVLDTLTTIQILAFRFWTAKQNAINPKWDEDIPDQGGHQKVQFMTRRYLSRWVDTDYNLLVLCHALQTEDNDGSGMWLPAIEGQHKKGHLVAQYCMGLMNAVGYMGVTTDHKDREHHRILWRTTHDPKKDVTYIAKEQYGGALGRYTDDLTMPELLAKAEAERPVKGKKSK